MKFGPPFLVGDGGWTCPTTICALLVIAWLIDKLRRNKIPYSKVLILPLAPFAMGSIRAPLVRRHDLGQTKAAPPACCAIHCHGPNHLVHGPWGMSGQTAKRC